MIEYQKREDELKGEMKMQNTAFYDIYKTSTGLYITEELCNEYLVGNKADQKNINGNTCYRITEQEMNAINQAIMEQGLKVIPNIITIFDLQLVFSFNVYIDTNHDNKLYIDDTTCERYNITPLSKRIVNNIPCGNVTEDDIEMIEDISKREKIALKRKNIEVFLVDEIKPADHLYMYYLDTETQKKYIRRDMFEFFKANEIEIEGNPKIIDDKNCYSITDNEILDVENKLHYRGIEQLLKPNQIALYLKQIQTQEKIFLLLLIL